MKTVKFLSTVLAVAIAAIATAVEKPQMSVVPLSSDKAIVSILNNNAAYFELSIHADNGDLVYYKQSAKPLTNYQKIFDFKDMENGNYTMDLKINDTRVSKEFTVMANEIKIGESKMTFDPFFKYSDGILRISYLNYDLEKYSVGIYNENGLVYKTELGKDFDLSSGFDLSELAEGKYDIVLSSLSNEFVYSLVK